MFLKTPGDFIGKIVQGFTDNIDKAKLTKEEVSSYWEFPPNDTRVKACYAVRVYNTGKFALVANTMSISGNVEDETLEIWRKRDCIGEVVLTDKMRATINVLISKLSQREEAQRTTDPLAAFLKEIEKGHMLAADYVERY